MNRNIAAIIFSAFFLVGLSGCAGNNTNFAPVTNGWKTSAASQMYRVQPGDTLYSIAFRFGLDYQQLAKANNVAPPYHILVGQTLKLLPGADDTLTTTPSAPVVTGAAPIQAPVKSQPVIAKTVAKPKPVPAAAPTPVTPAPALKLNGTGPVGKWHWPAKGPIIRGFSNAYGGNKGVDIAGKMGAPVRATAAGRVVYCGTGLRGYGLLIIIKHNAQYLSAYAHNSKALVKEGQVVKADQQIAKMGDTDAPRVMLHFEIRKSGRPVDPLALLPPRK